MKQIAPSVPLITVDPLFSVWSPSNTLHGDTTRHWGGKASPILAAVRHKGKLYYFAGADQTGNQLLDRVPQTDLEITPLSTKYTFENHILKATLTFTTPLLLDRLDILCRPASYIAYDVTIKGEKAEDTSFLFGVNARNCTNDIRQEVTFKKCANSACIGNAHQSPMAQSGDMVNVDWGYVHIDDRCARPGILKNRGIEYLPVNSVCNGFIDMPYLISTRKELSGVVTVGYDEIYAVEYFGTPILEMYREQFDSFDTMLAASVKEYTDIKALCDKFDADFYKETEKHGEKHQYILALAYRQAISAHKLAKDEDGKYLFLSKENGSNGCIGTLDVTYPSIPLFLRYNPELVNGMLRPIFKYADSDAWRYDFAPHDVGQYPLANGQVYGDDISRQMPVEECGNMLLCLAAVKKYNNGDTSLFNENKATLKLWADYLVKNGYDPGEQLCTDDFAGHLNHNCNLSLKAILGIASYALLSGDNSYMDIARGYASRWESEAASEKATRLTFDGADGWSLKYNMVWDNLLELNLFSEYVKLREIALYKEKFNRYGAPLDNRATYTKADWLMWCTRLTDDKEYFDMLNDSIINMLSETQDRVPFTDWYDTITAEHHFFRARSVVGGLFITMI